MFGTLVFQFHTVYFMHSFQFYLNFQYRTRPIIRFGNTGISKPVKDTRISGFRADQGYRDIRIKKYE